MRKLGVVLRAALAHEYPTVAADGTSARRSLVQVALRVSGPAGSAAAHVRMLREVAGAQTDTGNGRFCVWFDSRPWLSLRREHIHRSVSDAVGAVSVWSMAQPVEQVVPI